MVGSSNTIKLEYIKPKIEDEKNETKKEIVDEKKNNENNIKEETKEKNKNEL